MRIWIINHYAAPPTMAGGTRHFYFARQLIERGHEVIIIASNYSHFSHSYVQSDTKPGQIDYSHSVPFVWIPTPRYFGNTLARFWNMLVFSRRLLQKKYLPTAAPPDVILGSSPHLFAALGAELLARRFKIPFMLEVRDLWPETLLDLGRISPYHPMIKVMKQIEKYLYKRAKRIISLLPSADKYLVGHGVNPETILWLPNAIDTDIIPQHFPLVEKNKFTVMYAGAHGIANDLDTVVQAAKILQEKSLADKIRICLVGDGPEKLRLQQLVHQQHITMIEFIDSVAKNEIYSVLNQADAFLMLLKNSPLFRWGISPNKLFDYLAMGRPVIFGVDTPFNPIKQYRAGLSIAPSDSASLAEAIQQLSLLPKDELCAMGARGKAFVLEHHHIHQLTDRLEKAAMEVMA